MRPIRISAGVCGSAVLFGVIGCQSGLPISSTPAEAAVAQRPRHAVQQHFVVSRSTAPFDSQTVLAPALSSVSALTLASAESSAAPPTPSSTAVSLIAAESPPPPLPNPAASLDTTSTSGGPIAKETGWCATDLEIECRAASRVLTVPLLNEERRLIRRGPKADSAEGKLLDRVLGYRIAIQVNAQAAEAVIAWHDLQAGLVALAATDRSIAILDEVAADQDRAEQLGLVTAGGNAAEAELQRRRAELAASVAAGEATLVTLIGAPLPAPAPPTMLPSPPSNGDAVSMAMTVRPELNVLRAVITELDAKTLPVAIGVLQQSEPASGTAPRPKFWPFPSDEEIAARGRQLCVAMARQEQAVVAEVETALELLRGLDAQYLHANEVVASRAAEIERLEARRNVATDVDTAEITEARLALITAEAERDRIACESHKAWARLRAAQGLPAVDCGYISPPPAY